VVWYFGQSYRLESIWVKVRKPMEKVWRTLCSQSWSYLIIISPSLRTRRPSQIQTVVHFLHSDSGIFICDTNHCRVITSVSSFPLCELARRGCQRSSHLAILYFHRVSLNETWWKKDLLANCITLRYKFRPHSDNPYTQVPTDEEEDYEQDLPTSLEAHSLQHISRRGESSNHSN
jgi:hypothetical protein